MGSQDAAGITHNADPALECQRWCQHIMDGLRGASHKTTKGHPYGAMIMRGLVSFKAALEHQLQGQLKYVTLLLNGGLQSWE